MCPPRDLSPEIRDESEQQQYPDSSSDESSSDNSSSDDTSDDTSSYSSSDTESSSDSDDEEYDPEQQPEQRYTTVTFLSSNVYEQQQGNQALSLSVRMKVEEAYVIDGTPEMRAVFASEALRRTQYILDVFVDLMEEENHRREHLGQPTLPPGQVWVHMWKMAVSQFVGATITHGGPENAMIANPIPENAICFMLDLALELHEGHQPEDFPIM